MKSTYTSYELEHFFSSSLAVTDGAVQMAIELENTRQEEQIELIASENIVSKAVMETQGTVLTNKYAEGYPGRRYYGGCEYVDLVETLAIDRAKQLFDAQFVNVQPHSGAPANLAMYFALLDPGDTVLGMDLSHGGHLTHGHPVTSITKVFNFVRYKMKDTETGEIDYDALRKEVLLLKTVAVVEQDALYLRQELRSYHAINQAYAGDHRVHTAALQRLEVEYTFAKASPRRNPLLEEDEHVKKRYAEALQSLEAACDQAENILTPTGPVTRR